MRALARNRHCRTPLCHSPAPYKTVLQVFGALSISSPKEQVGRTGVYRRLQEVERFLNLLKDRGQASVGALDEDNRVERGDEARDGCQWR